MANTIRLKRSSTPSSAPSSGQLVEGELAINTADEKLYSKDSTTVFKIGTYAGDAETIIGGWTFDTVETNFNEDSPIWTNGAGWYMDVASGGQVWFENSLDTGALVIGGDGSSTAHASIAGNGIVDRIEFASLNFLQLATGCNLEWYDGDGLSSLTSFVDLDTMYFDGTNSIVDVDFINLTGTLKVEGTAVSLSGHSHAADDETITGTWTMDGPVTTSDYGTGGRVKDGLDNTQPIGFNTMPVYAIDAADAFDLAHNGMLWYKSTASAVTYTCNSDTTIPVGATYVLHNAGAGAATIAAGTASVYWIEGGSAPASGNVTVAEGGIVTVYKYTDAVFWVWGSKASGAVSLALDDLTDVAITSSATGDILRYNGTNYVDYPDSNYATAAQANATHTGQVTGATALSLAVSAITAQPASGALIATDTILVNDGGVLSESTFTQLNTYFNSSLSFAPTASPTFTTKLTTDPVFINEAASASADVTGDGQIWVKNNAPNDLYFTGDTGIDYPVGYARYRCTADTTLDGANLSETLGEQHINGVWYSDNATAYTLTLEASGATTFPVGAQLTIWNEGAGTLTINEGTGTTLYILDGSAVTDTAGGCTMAQGGYATLIRKSTTVYLLMGAGLTA